MSRIARTLLAVNLALVALWVSAGGTLAAKPEIVQSGTYTDTFEDDFILDLCGIETLTTVTERWTLMTYADGSQRFTVSRRFVPDDPRIPTEYGAGMSTWDSNGIQTVHGSPIRLYRRGERVVLLAAGYITLSDDPTIHGPHFPLDMDLAPYYCPWEA
jgi:hypothetical protein